MNTAIGLKQTLLYTLLIPKKSTTNNGIKGTSYPYVHAPHAQNPHNPSLSRFEVFPNAQTFRGKPEPLHSTQYPDHFVTYTEEFNMHTGQPNPSSITNDFIFGKIVLNISNNKYVFPAMNVSNKFATIDNDALINTKTDYTINHVFCSMTVQESNTLHTICKLERNQLLTILAMSVQNPQLAAFLLPGNRSNFLYVVGFTAWLYDCPHFLSPLYKPEPIKRKPPLMFTPSQIKTTIRPNTFTAQDAGIYSNAELDQFWIRILFSKHSDSTLQLRGKTPSYSFFSSDTPDYDANSPYDNPYKTLRIGLHDKLLNLTPLFTPTWFSDAFIGLFGYPCYVLTQCGIYADNDEHINTKTDYTINHVFRSMTVQESNTLHTICELERNQLLTILAMSVQNPQLAGFLLQEIAVISLC